MRIFWSDFASGILIEIVQYYKEKAGDTAAQKIKFAISLVFNDK
jgi:hypothetical protein